MHVTNDEDRGIYDKYTVTRNDGSSEPGGKHEHCDYFVLDLTHDPFAIPALAAYVVACAVKFPKLADDLRKKLNLKPKAEEPPCRETKKPMKRLTSNYYPPTFYAVVTICGYASRWWSFIEGRFCGALTAHCLTESRQYAENTVKHCHDACRVVRYLAVNAEDIEGEPCRE